MDDRVEEGATTLPAASAAATPWSRRVLPGLRARGVRIAVPLVAVCIALFVCAALLSVANVAPLEAYRAMLVGAFGTRANSAITLSRATPLVLIGLGVAFAMRAKFINVGGEGQLYFGALVGTWAAITFGSLPALVVISLALVLAAAAGALWALIPGLLKVYRGSNEVITTILLNYVGVGMVSYFIYGPFRDPSGSQYPQTEPIPPNARLPRLGPIMPLDVGVWLAVVLAIVLAVALYRTATGYELRVIGSSPKAAEYTAIPVTRRVLLVVVVAGGLAGIAGAVEIMGAQIRLVPDFMPGVAFTAIVVALLGQNRPSGVVIAGVFIGALFNGGEAMQRATGTPSVIVYAVEALVVIFLLTGLELRSRQGGAVRRLMHGLRSREGAASPPQEPALVSHGTSDREGP